MPPPLPNKIPCTSEQHLKDELVNCQDVLTLPETEDSWEKLFRAISKLTALIKGGAYKHPYTLVSGVKSMSRPLISAMNSERTRLSATVLELLTTMISKLNRHFEPLMPVFIPSVLKLSTRTNKLYISRARALFDTVTGQTSLSSIVPYFQGCWDDKSTTLRVTAAESMVDALKKFNPPDLARHIPQVETAILSTGVDKDPLVRTAGRKMFECYKVLWPERVDGFTAPMAPITRRYLEVPTRTRTISTVTDTRDTFSASVPGSQATSRPGLRRSLSLDALDDLNASKLDRRLQVHQPDLTKLVPVRRAAKVIRKQEPCKTAAAAKVSEIQQLAPVPKAPTLSRGISLANLRSKAKDTASEQITSQPEAKGARRVVHVPAPVVPTASRSGPSRPNPIPPSSTVCNSKEAPKDATSSKEPVAAPIASTQAAATESRPNGGGERRGQGAQRVAIPPPAPPVPKVEKKETSNGPSRSAQPVEKLKSFRPQSRTGRTEVKSPIEAIVKAGSSRDQSVARSEQTSKDSRPTSRADSSRPNSRLHTRVPPAKPVPSKPPTSKSAQANQKEESKETRPAPVRRGLTAPTRAQLQREKALEGERGKAKAAIASTRGMNLSKRGFVPTRGRGISRGAGPRTVVARPNKDDIPEAQVPLPASPKDKARDQEKAEKDVALESLPEIASKNLLQALEEANEKVEGQQDEKNDLPHPPSQAPLEVDEPKSVEANAELENEEGETPTQPVNTTVQPTGAISGSMRSMSEMDRLLFASPMKTIIFEPPMVSSPFNQERSQKAGTPMVSNNNSPQVRQEENEHERLKPQIASPTEKAHDPYASLPFFLKEVLAAPIPPTPNVRPSPFIRFEPDDTTISYTSTRHEEELEDDATMEKLEFAINGVDQFGRIIHSPCKKSVTTTPRDALIDLSVNQ